MVELVSPSDAGPRGAEALRRKLALYRANGAGLGWLLFPEERAVEIWRAEAEGAAAGEAERMAMAGTPERIEAAEVLEGGVGRAMVNMASAATIPTGAA